MMVDYILAEIGSTTTVVTALKKEEKVSVIGQGKSYTTVLDGDVIIGLKNAISEIELNIGEKIQWKRMLATSSAAGGLKITVHGLVEDMTVKAAKEAALGAGGIIKLITAGKLKRSEINRIREINPNLIMLAGGTEYGEYETALYNAEIISKEKFNKPIIYCGNCAIRNEIREIFADEQLYIVDNVYPRVDELNVEPAKKVIQDAFEKNIVKAPGMDKIKEMVDGTIMPTPGAVMESAKLLYEMIGDLVVLDVGGATTDVHSVTEGSLEIQDILVTPEPRAKRTVEGDLGVFINSENVMNLLSERELKGVTREYLKENIKPIPKSEDEINCSLILTEKAVETAINRHAGHIRRVYGTAMKFMAFGKDLSKIKYIVGTGGALTRLPKGKEILSVVRYLREDLSMLPPKGAKILIDEMYIMACAGVLSKEDKEAAKELLKESLRL